MATKLTANSETCPHCNANLLSSEIPEKRRKAYGNAKYFIRTIGIIDPEQYRVVAWECPDCGKRDACGD